MARIKTRIALLLTAALLAVTAGCAASPAAPSNQADPVTVTIWTYYNGAQLESFNQLVDEFNSTVGLQQNIVVETYSQGSVTDLENNVLDAAEGKVGAPALPNIFSAYSDNAYALDQMGLVVDLRNYLTAEEQSAYIQGYLKEGDFSGDGSIKILPVAKSTELLFLNQTDWEPFAADTGVTYDDLATIEGLVSVAGRYYQWSGGKAFFGRDAMANYILIGAKQLGCTIFNVEDGGMTLNFDRAVARKLWDNYYVPFVKGWFTASGRFRSDDMKIGSIIAYVGSSSSATFFPAQVTLDDASSYDIQRQVLPAPRFAGGEDYAVQQGAGMVVTKASEEEIRASVTFLKWFTAPEHNIAFSVGSGYLPVTTAGSSMDAIRASGLELSDSADQLLSVAVTEVGERQLYTPAAFSGGSYARSVLEYALSDRAEADRAEVLARMAEGMSYEEALAEFLSDDCFDAWYQDTTAALQAYAR